MIASLVVDSSDDFLNWGTPISKSDFLTVSHLSSFPISQDRAAHLMVSEVCFLPLLPLSSPPSIFVCGQTFYGVIMVERLSSSKTSADYLSSPSMQLYNFSPTCMSWYVNRHGLLCNRLYMCKRKVQYGEEINKLNNNISKMSKKEN